MLSSLSIPFPRLQHMWADSNYGGTLIDWVQQHLGCVLEIVKRPQPFNPWDGLPKKKGRPTIQEREARAQYLSQFSHEELYPAAVPYQAGAHRWVVERTFGWITHSRRLARDDEGLPQCSEAFIQVALSRIMLRRLVRPYS
ncbi:hypothetical protein KDK_69570 [Dictyobacter kobayashii]|uniref:Transposase DDE domain-containing protein n=1 Tax=Dictyobacter kobayashii TaxID=2014872 RepID=A0A402AVN6_9CHLR|nr:hypothetical protein KDK_69570 [Dictyobacter kobayashii]